MIDLSPKDLINTAYVLHEKIGEGGMGGVYRATHRLTGRKVALKCVHIPSPEVKGSSTEVIDTHEHGNTVSLRLSITKEFQTLASLHHPNIVNVLDYGFINQQIPFFTMELLDHPMTILEAGRNQPIRKKVDLLVQLLRALAYLHRRKILHRDIKPSNVLVVNQQVKLLDFGISEAAGGRWQLAGTIGYMAPELLLGLPPSISTDLYAVGVLTFELLTGRFPHDMSSNTRFLESVLGEDADATLAPGVVKMVEMVEMHSGPASRVPSIETMTDQALLQSNLAELPTDSAPFIEIVGKLRARTSEERYQDPSLVIQDLGVALGEALSVETTTTRESFLVAAQFIGREAEMQRLAGALTAALTGQGSVVMVSGESGVGKTRLTSELRTMALVNSAKVVSTQGSTEKGRSYQLWAPIVRTLSLENPLTGEEIGVLRDIAPDLESLLGRPAVPPPARSPQAAKVRLHSTVEALFRRQTTPLVVLLEDLQWAEMESLELLERLYSVVSQLPVLLLGNYREDEANETLRSLPAHDMVRLKRLDRSQVAQLSYSMIGETGRHPVLVDYLLRHTEGNVFFLIEVVRALAHNVGQLANIATEGLPEQLLTGGIERLVERRLEQIPKENYPLLELAAVAGRRLDLKVLGQASGQSELTPWLQLCANAAVLDPQQGQWQFAHDKIREFLQKQLQATKTQSLHYQIAEAITTVYGENGGQDAALAYHWECAGVHDRAHDYYITAGQSASRLNALVGARAAFANALRMLSLLPETTVRRRQRVDELLLLVSISVYAERFERILAYLQEAESVLESLRSTEEYADQDHARFAKVIFWMGRMYFANGDISAASERFMRARKLAEDCKDEAMRALATGLYGNCLGQQGYMGQALPYVTEAVRSLERQAIDGNFARMASIRGTFLVCNGKVTEGLEWSLRGLQAAKDPSMMANCAILRALTLCYCQEWEAAEVAATSGAAQALENGDELYRCVALWLIAWSKSWLGKREESHENQAQAQAIYLRVKDMILLDQCLVAEADMALNEGEIARAFDFAHKALEKSRALKFISSEVMAYLVWAKALLLQPSPQVDEAEAHLGRCVDLSTKWEFLIFMPQVRMLLAHARYLRGDREGALGHLAQAAALAVAYPLPKLLAYAQAMQDDIHAGRPLRTKSFMTAAIAEGQRTDG
jgi:serine/threonine protein kinase/tetratricopeptide (TPR) repeat protein